MELTERSWSCPCETSCDVCQAQTSVFTTGARVAIPAGTPLWRAGDAATHVALLCRGVVTMGVMEADGKRQVTGLEAQGAVLGMDDTLWSGRRDTDVVALVPCQALVLETETVLGAIRRGGDAAISLTRLFGRASRFALRRIREVGYGSVTERIARVLVYVLDKVSLADARGTFVPVPIGRTQLAELVGCRVETLVRMLKASPLAEIVIFQREGFVVADVRALRRLATCRTM